MMVPLVNQYAQAGYMMGWADVAYIETLPKIRGLLTKNIKVSTSALKSEVTAWTMV